MTTLSPNPFASPASLPEPNAMNQYNMSGAQVQPEPTAMTQGQRAIAAYRRTGGPMVRGIGTPPATGYAGMTRTAPGGVMAPPTSGNFGTVQQMMGQPPATPQLSTQAQNAANVLGTPNARAAQPAPIRPPAFVNPVRATTT